MLATYSWWMSSKGSRREDSRPESTSQRERTQALASTFQRAYKEENGYPGEQASCSLVSPLSQPPSSSPSSRSAIDASNILTDASLSADSRTSLPASVEARTAAVSASAKACSKDAMRLSAAAQLALAVSTSTAAAAAVTEPIRASGPLSGWICFPRQTFPMGSTRTIGVSVPAAVRGGANADTDTDANDDGDGGGEVCCSLSVQEPRC